MSCSGHCLNNAVCDYINGKCSDGCQPGYIGKLCNDCKIYKSFIYSVLDYSFVTKYVSYFLLILKPAKTVIMDKTVLEFAPQSARHVNPLTEHVVALLVGWDLTVVLVFVKLFKIIQHLK